MKTPVYSTAHLEVSASTPRAHVPHPAGRWSINIAEHPSIVYLIGTPDELIDWATKVRAVAIDLLRET